MKTKEKLVLNGKTLFKFEQNHDEVLDTIPTTWTITKTTTGFSKDRPVQSKEPLTLRK